MAKTLDDIFDDDDFGLLNSKEQSPSIKTDEDRMIDSFEEINTFFEKNDREPSSSSMSEYNLLARLKGFRNDEKKKKILKPIDRFDLLGYIEIEKKTFEEILEDDDLGLLESDGDSSIFEFNHTPKPEKRTEADYVAQRQPIAERDFKKYEQMFQRVHQDIKEGKRKFVEFVNIEKNLQIGNYYLLDGLLLYLKSAELEEKFTNVKSGGRLRIDGRTVTIFENGTKSNMLYRSLGKQIQKNGKLITQTTEYINNDFTERSIIKEEDLDSGWIYILKSKSKNSDISSVQDLYKIGFSTTNVNDRIKNAKKEATFLYDDVEVVATYKCYNLNTHGFENLIHRFFGECCLNIDIYNEAKQRANPREWFVAPLPIINEAIELLINGSIINYRYDNKNNRIVLK